MRCWCCGAPRKPVYNRCAVCGAPIHLSAPLAVQQQESATPPTATDEVRVARDGTPLRDRARGPAAVLQTLDTGDLVHVLGQSGKYMRVRAANGVSGYVDTAQLSWPGSPPALQPQAPDEAEASASGQPPVGQAPGTAGRGRVDLPFGIDGLAGESVDYVGKFIYDPFNDRAFVVTSHRVIIGGGGAPMPRVVELLDILSAQMREGSNGMAVGERTIVLQVGHIPGETYIAGLRDPERALASLSVRMREAHGSASEPAS